MVLEGKDFARVIYIYAGDSDYTASFIREMKVNFPGAESYKGMVDVAIDDRLGDCLLMYDDLHTKARLSNCKSERTSNMFLNCADL